jgi:hypothetical protein
MKNLKWKMTNGKSRSLDPVATAPATDTFYHNKSAATSC